MTSGRFHTWQSESWPCRLRPRKADQSALRLLKKAKGALSMLIPGTNIF